MGREKLMFSGSCEHLKRLLGRFGKKMTIKNGGWQQNFVKQLSFNKNKLDKWILFNGWVIFHGVYVPQLPDPFVCWWASRLLPCPGYYKQCCDEWSKPER